VNSISIVSELQQAALGNDVQILLRMAYFTAEKLNKKDFVQRTQHEMNGYGDEDTRSG
jgi:hypothetical protein